MTRMWGLDFLALACYPKIAADNLPPNWALGCFLSTFGDARPGIERVIKTGKCPRVRVHLMWKDNHSFSQKDLPTLKKEAEKLKNLVSKYPHVDWRVSGACEHTMNSTDANAFRKTVLEVLPTVTYVNTPMTGGAKLTGCVNEIHGGSASSGRYDFSFDGNPCVDANVSDAKTKYEKAETFWWWDARMNLRWESNDTTPRPERIKERDKRKPDSRLIQSIVYLVGQRGKTSFPSKDWLWKSHAENKGNGDLRAEKPVFIIPKKASKVVLKDKKGRVVHELKYYGLFHDGRHRYYATKWGFEISKDAAKADGGIGLTDFFIDGKRYGTCNAAYRGGSFRG